MSDTDDTSTVAGAEPPEQAPPVPEQAPQAPEQAPQVIDAPQSERSRRGAGWFSGGVRAAIVAGVVVLVAGAFFTIGWFTSTGGDDDRPRLMDRIDQRMDMRERGDLRGGTDERGLGECPGCPSDGRGMMVPQQGQGWGQVVPGPQPQPEGQFSPQSYLGVGVETVTPSLQQQYGLSQSSGVVVTSLDRSGPAFAAGIRQGDVITSIDGAPVTQREDVVAAVANSSPWDSVSVTVDRNGRSLIFQVTLLPRPASAS